MLVSANILRHTSTVDTKEKDSTTYIPVSIKSELAHSRLSEVGGLLQYAMFNNKYWHRVKVLHRAVV